MTRLLLTTLALVATFTLAGCGEDNDRAATGGETTTETSPTETAPTETVPEPFPATTPGRALTRFVRAAAADDLQAMWELLSVPSQRRLGPSLEVFRTGAGRNLATELGRFVRGRSRVFLEEPITATFAVAAYGGRTAVGNRRPFASYAVALRLDGGDWRIELDGPVEIRPLGPDPGETQRGPFQLAAGVKANAPVVEGGLWLDGQAVPGRTAGNRPSDVTMFSDSQGRIPAGPHAVVAFAATFADASALAWNFVYQR